MRSLYLAQGLTTLIFAFDRKHSLAWKKKRTKGHDV